MIIRSKAPGKMILLGEYAVLEGAPALVAAVNRYAHITIEENDEHHFKIESPSLGIGYTPFSVSPHGIICFEDQDKGNVKKLGFFRVIFEFLWLYFKSCHKILQPISISLDTDAFYAKSFSSKLGFGSSAAMTVVLTQALFQYCCSCGKEEEQITKIFRLALSSHRKAQGNLGSGVDIAASTFGGVISYEMGLNKKAEQKKPESLKIWKDLHLACIWTGTSESTRKMVRGVGQLKKAYPQIYKEKLKKMSDLAHQGYAAYKNQSISNFLEVVEKYQSCLRDLGEKSGMPIVSPVHMKLVEKIRNLKGVYKPSGAGSGDIGVAFAENANDIEKISNMVKNEGYSVIPVKIASAGVHSYSV